LTLDILGKKHFWNVWNQHKIYLRNEWISSIEANFFPDGPKSDTRDEYLKFIPLKCLKTSFKPSQVDEYSWDLPWNEILNAMGIVLRDLGRLIEKTRTL
jgi:hypothetical protein